MKVIIQKIIDIKVIKCDFCHEQNEGYDLSPQFISRCICCGRDICINCVGDSGELNSSLCKDCTKEFLITIDNKLNNKTLLLRNKITKFLMKAPYQNDN